VSFDVKIDSDSVQVAMPIPDLSEEYRGHLNQVVAEVLEFISGYAINMKALEEASDLHDLDGANILLAQNMKARVVFQKSLDQLKLAQDHLSGVVTASDLGFPEFERDGVAS